MKEFKFNPVRKILVPTDFSENADHAVHYAASIASRLGSKLILFHSVKVPAIVMDETVQAISDENLIKDSNALLDKLKEKLKNMPIPVDAETSTSIGFAVDEITGYCESKKSDLIIMGTKGAHGLGGMLIGSNTAEVISKANCPVLAVPQETSIKGIHKVLFATNYSDNDFQSIFLLTEIFKPWRPEIIIVHVEDSHHPRVENSYFERFKEQVVTNIAYDKFYFKLLDEANAEDAVSGFATANQVDIICVSKRKRTLFEKLIGVSISKRLAYHTHIPLLVFHAD